MERLLKKVINEKCKKFAKEIWNADFNVPIIISKQLSRALGRYNYRLYRTQNNLHMPISITFASKLFEYYSEKDVDGVIKHELTHWFLGVNNKPSSDGHPVFENELKRIGAPSTRQLPSLGIVHTAICEKCGEIIVLRKRACDIAKYINGNRYSSRCCNSRLILGEIKENGNKSNGFLASLSEKTKVEKAKVEKTKVEKPKVENEMKPAQKIKQIFSNLLHKLNNEQISNLTSIEFCEKAFGLKYSFLKEFKNNDDRKINGHNRYYSGTITIFGKQYLMCNDLYLKNVSKFENWSNQI